MQPIMTSNAADDESPLPVRTSLVVYAAKLPQFLPLFLKALATPARIAADEPFL